MLTTLFMLVFGDYADMHKQVLAPLLGQDAEKISIRLWLNAVCLETFEWLLKHAPESWLIYVSSQNPPKYPVMRKLFSDPQHPIVTPWVTWLDDDTRIVYADWLAQTEEFVAATSAVDFFGAQYWKTHLAGVQKWIRQAAWYEERPFMRADASRGSNIGRLGIAFLRGSYWWLRTDILRELDWPDPRLNHNGGDTALSEAIWQTRRRQLVFAYGIDNELAPRRGRSERPAGFSHNHVNHSDRSEPVMLGRMDQYEHKLDQAHIPFLKLNESTLLVGGSAEYTDVEWLLPVKDIRQTAVPLAPPVPPAASRRKRRAASRKRKPIARKQPAPEKAEEPETQNISAAARKTIRARLLERLRKKRQEQVHSEQRRMRHSQSQGTKSRRQDSRPR